MRAMIVALIGLGLFACAEGGAPGVADDGPGLQIEVAALALDGVENATYTLAVLNESGQEVWSRSLDADSYGDGAGSISYVGPCDADDDADGDGNAENTVALVLEGLVDANGPLTDGVDFVNPAPAGSPLTRTAVCADNADAAVSFEITIARRARQGFFDVAVTFDDLFCSAKLDCRRDSNGDGQITTDDDPLLLLHQGTTRNTTVVVGLACTGGPGAADETVLYRSEVNVTCAGGAQATVDPGAGLGRITHTSTGADPLFGAAVYAGDEQLGFDKRYWNVALGLAGGTDCVATATATASTGGLTDDATPADSPWPVIVWDVNLTDGAGVLTCTSHPVDGLTGVGTSYLSGATFSARYPALPEPPPPLYGTALNPADSCLDLRTVRPETATTDGLYWVDPLDTGAFEVWCDMTGGGWTLVYRGVVAANTWNIGFTINTTGQLGTLPVTPALTGTTQSKLSDAVINAMRSGAVANDLKLALYTGSPLSLLGTSWHRNACTLTSSTNRPVGSDCHKSTLLGPTSTNYQDSTHSGALTRWYVAPQGAIGYIWGAVGIHIGPVTGGTGHGSSSPDPFCTWYQDSRKCPVGSAIELWIY